MRQFSSEMTIFAVGAKQAQAFTAAVTNIITSNAHGLSVGDCLQFTTSTTLPAGLSLLTNYYVISKTTNTFKVSATPGGTEVDITDTGTGTHTYHLYGKVFMVSDWKNVEVALYTANSASMTIKIQGSNQDTVDFNAAQSSTNRWDYVQLKDLNNENAINGDTGIALTGTDEAANYEINTNAFKYVTAIVTSYTAGNLNLIMTGYSD